MSDISTGLAAEFFANTPQVRPIETAGANAMPAGLQPGEPLWWVYRLSRELSSRSCEVDKARDWYKGEHPIPPPPIRTLAHYDLAARREFEMFARLGISNFMAPVVDQVAGKLVIEGFHFGMRAAETPGQEATDAELDRVATEIWQRNNLDADSTLVNTESIKVGTAFALVWADVNGKAEITTEDPECCIVAYESGSRRRRAAGFKQWMDDLTGDHMATLYLPGAVYKYRAPEPKGGEKALRWVPRFVDGEPWPVENPVGVVPLVELRSNQCLEVSTFGGGEPEFERATRDQERINRTLMGMLITQEHQAFRQRWVTGWGLPVDEAGNVLEDIAKMRVLKAAAGSLMAFEDDVKVGEFAQADFRPFIDAVNLNARLIASTTSTPPRAFLLGELINVAADALTAIEDTFTAKVGRHQLELAEPWEEVMRLAFAFEGRTDLAADTSSSVVWKDPKSISVTERANVAQVMRNVGAPDEAVFAALPGVTQQEASRWAGGATPPADPAVPPA